MKERNIEEEKNDKAIERKYKNEARMKENIGARKLFIKEKCVSEQ